MHLLVDISAHGLGHLAQTAPVLAELALREPSLRLTVRSGLSTAQLKARIHHPFSHIPEASDFGFSMHNAVDIDYAASLSRYRQVHRDWAVRVDQAAEQIRALEADLVLANAAYLPLAAAARAGVPAIGMCSLNWADLFHHYFPDETAIHEQILSAYNAATAFLRITPGMPMPGFTRCRPIGPIAHLAKRTQARAVLDADLQLPAGARCVLVAMGGMEFRLPVERWPQHEDLIWLCPAAWGIQRGDVRAFDDIGWTFTDLLANVDAVLTKPGYGTFAEAACNGTPVLYVPRDDWPEEGPLAEWLGQNARCATVSRAQLSSGEVHRSLAALWQQKRPALPFPSGSGEAAGLILSAVVNSAA